MDVDILKTVGQVAGIGGVALGVFLILFRELLRKNIFPQLTRDQSYRLLHRISVLVWSVAVIGIGAWVYVDTRPAVSTAGGVAAGGDVNVGGDIVIDGGSQPSPSP